MKNVKSIFTVALFAILFGATPLLAANNGSGSNPQSSTVNNVSMDEVKRLHSDQRIDDSALTGMSNASDKHVKKEMASKTAQQPTGTVIYISSGVVVIVLIILLIILL